MSFHYETRKKSIITDADALEYLDSIQNFPVFIGATEDKFENDKFSDLTWDICQDTGCIQLRNLLSPELIYSGYHSEALGGIWAEHHQEFQAFSERFLGNEILEIGGSNGMLANSILANNNHVNSYTIVEPNPDCKATDRLKVVKDFFSSKTRIDDHKKFDTILHSHTFEHSYDPIDFLNGIINNIEYQGMHVFSVPNLKRYLEKKFTNTLNFEHTYFLTSELTEDLLNRFGFTCIEKYEFGDHSIFYSFKYDGGLTPRPYKNYYYENKKAFFEYIEHHNSEITRLNKLLDEHDGDLFLFGGHIFSQFLLTLGLQSKNIKSILDNSKFKEGKRLYGTHFLIGHPNCLQFANDPAVILKAGQYQAEIKQQIKSIRPSCKIFE